MEYNSFYEASIILTPKPPEDSTGNVYSPVYIMNTDKKQKKLKAGEVLNMINTLYHINRHMIVSMVQQNIWQDTTFAYDKNAQKTE